MITCVFMGFSFSVPRQVEKAHHEGGVDGLPNEGRRKGRRNETHVERLPKPTTRIMVEKRPASGSRVDEILGGDQGSLWCGLLGHE
jgi:hypothetical protein